MREWMDSWHTSLKISASFFMMIVIGFFFLILPISQAPGSEATSFDHFFHAVSLVTVTGLVIHPVAQTYSLFGQVVSLVLMQVGGLGLMTIIARPASVYGLMLPFKMKKNQLAVIAFAGLRGAAAIAFAISVVNSDTPNVNDLYHIVFDICLLSSLIQGGLLPVLSQKTGMVDPEDASLRNFNSLQDKSDVGFLATRIEPGSHLADAYIRDVTLAFDFIIAKILREGETILPKGDVQLKVGDIVVLAGRAYFDAVGTDLLEFRINHYNRWVNKEIKNIHLDHAFLIVLVLRDDNEMIVPNGDTKILEGDTVLVLDAKGIEG